MNKKILTNSERKTPRKYFLRNETHEELQTNAEKENISPSAYLQKMLDIYKNGK